MAQLTVPGTELDEDKAVGVLAKLEELEKLETALNNFTTLTMFSSMPYKTSDNRELTDNRGMKKIKEVFGVETFPYFQVVLEQYRIRPNNYTHSLDILPTTDEHMERFKKYYSIACSIGRTPYHAIAGAKLKLGPFLCGNGARDAEVVPSIGIENLQKYRWKKAVDDKTIDIFPEFENWEDIVYTCVQKIASRIFEKTKREAKVMIIGPDEVADRWAHEAHLGTGTNIEYVREKIKEPYARLIEKHGGKEVKIYSAYDHHFLSKFESSIPLDLNGKLNDACGWIIPRTFYIFN
jgi:hypothetical protein